MRTADLPLCGLFATIAALQKTLSLEGVKEELTEDGQCQGDYLNLRHFVSYMGLILLNCPK